MSAKISFFPVDNGDMTLLAFESGRRVVVDVNIRQAADDEDEDTPDVASMLRDRLKRDSQGRLYVDAFLLSHPDEDHCRGLERHFHLGPTNTWKKADDKIIIREMWSSPIVFRRKDRIGETICSDAEAWRNEARRRVNLYKTSKSNVDDGDRVLVLGEDIDHKTDGIDAILVRVDECFSKICGESDYSFEVRLLAPLPPSKTEEEEDVLAKNRSSVITQIRFSADGVADACFFLTGGDAEVAIWERQWTRHSKEAEVLQYHLMQAPHHCSWRSLSEDSWSTLGPKAKVNEKARSALAQALPGAFIVASSKTIKDDKDDPPCIRAKREYEGIAKSVDGAFKCTADHPTASAPDVMEFDIGSVGPRLKTRSLQASMVAGSTIIGRQPLPHGQK